MQTISYYAGYLNFIKVYINHVLLRIQVCELLLYRVVFTLTSFLIAIKNHVIKYLEKVNEKNDKNLI